LPHSNRTVVMPANAKAHGEARVRADPVQRIVSAHKSFVF
jgi:hypothetical protein